MITNSGKMWLIDHRILCDNLKHFFNDSQPYYMYETDQYWKTVKLGYWGMVSHPRTSESPGPCTCGWWSRWPEGWHSLGASPAASYRSSQSAPHTGPWQRQEGCHTLFRASQSEHSAKSTVERLECVCVSIKWFSVILTSVLSLGSRRSTVFTR